MEIASKRRRSERALRSLVAKLSTQRQPPPRQQYELNRGAHARHATPYAKFSYRTSSIRWHQPIGFVVGLRSQAQPRKTSAKVIRESAHIPLLIYALQAEARASCFFEGYLSLSARALRYSPINRIFTSLTASCRALRVPLLPIDHPSPPFLADLLSHTGRPDASCC
jgi:hypothetical protein